MVLKLAVEEGGVYKEAAEAEEEETSTTTEGGGGEGGGGGGAGVGVAGACGNSAIDTAPLFETKAAAAVDAIMLLAASLYLYLSISFLTA